MLGTCPGYIHPARNRRRKLPVTTLLMALESDETEKLREKAAQAGKEIALQDVTGMSPEAVLNYFYDTVTFEKIKRAWKTKFVADSFRGFKSTSDLVNAKPGRIIVKAGTKITPRLLRGLEGNGLKEILVLAEDLIGR